MTQRSVYFLGLLIIIATLGMGFYLEYYQGIMPCPLCTLQRICFGILGTLFFIGLIMHRKTCIMFVTNLLVTLFSATGIFLAGRQIWIQLYPASSGGDCGVSLQFMLSALPLTDVIQKIFNGTAECSQRGWEWLGLNIPEWSILFFGLFFVMGCFYLIRGCRRC